MPSFASKGFLVCSCLVSAAGAWDLEAAAGFAESCCKTGGCSECPCNTGGELGANLTHPDECQCECAEFVSHILKHGGDDDGDIINCIPLFSWLDSHSDWHRINDFHTPSQVQRGDVIIYDVPGEGPKTHTCFGIGNGIVDCHNNNHCHANADMGYEVAGIFRHGPKMEDTNTSAVKEYTYTDEQLVKLASDARVKWHEPAPDDTPIPDWAYAYGNGTDLTGMKVSQTRADVIERATHWVTEEKPYCQCNDDCCGHCDMCSMGSPPYRCDCSGFVSRCWDLPGGLVTQTLHTVSHEIEKHELKPGDVMLYAAEHVVIFNGWTDDAMTNYHAIQEPGCHSSLPPHAVANIEPYPMSWSPDEFKPYRYNNIVD